MEGKRRQKGERLIVTRIKAGVSFQKEGGNTK